MKLPESIRVLHRTFDVVELTEENRDISSSLGVADFHRDKIHVCMDQPYAQIVETIFHEVAHCVNKVCHVDDATTEEEQVTRTTGVWLAVYRDNPELLEILCEFCGTIPFDVV